MLIKDFMTAPPLIGQIVKYTDLLFVRLNRQ